MAHRSKHYVPAISRFLVCVLFHEGKRRGMKMTALVAELLSNQLRNTPSWKTAEEQLGITAAHQPSQDDQPRKAA